MCTRSENMDISLGVSYCDCCRGRGKRNTGISITFVIFTVPTKLLNKNLDHLTLRKHVNLKQVRITHFMNKLLLSLDSLDRTVNSAIVFVSL